MSNLIKIASYEKDIDRLIKIAKIYEEVENLTGGFYTDMVAEIGNQIMFCKNCIKNLQEIKNA